jgi:hypothetical protein
MNAQSESRRETAGGSSPTCKCTFGYYTQTSPWTDVREVAWPDLAAMLTTHEIGPKEGTCIVPAGFTGSRLEKGCQAYRRCHAR